MLVSACGSRWSATRAGRARCSGQRSCDRRVRPALQRWCKACRVGTQYCCVDGLAAVPAHESRGASFGRGGGGGDAPVSGQCRCMPGRLILYLRPWCAVNDHTACYTIPRHTMPSLHSQLDVPRPREASAGEGWPREMTCRACGPVRFFQKNSKHLSFPSSRSATAQRPSVTRTCQAKTAVPSAELGHCMEHTEAALSTLNGDIDQDLLFRSGGRAQALL